MTRPLLAGVAAVAAVAASAGPPAAASASAATIVAITDGGARISVTAHGSRLVAHDGGRVGLRLPPHARPVELRGWPTPASAAVHPDGMRTLAVALRGPTRRSGARIAAAQWRPGARAARLRWITPSSRIVDVAPVVAARGSSALVVALGYRPYGAAIAHRRPGQRWTFRFERDPRGSSGETLFPAAGWTAGGLPQAVWPSATGAHAAWGERIRPLRAAPVGRYGAQGAQVRAGAGIALVAWLDDARQEARLVWRRERGPAHRLLVGRSVTRWMGFADVALGGDRFAMAWAGRDDRLRVRLGRLGGRLTPVRRFGVVAGYASPVVLVGADGRSSVVFSGLHRMHALTLSRRGRVLAHRRFGGAYCDARLLASPSGRHVTVVGCGRPRLLSSG